MSLRPFGRPRSSTPPTVAGDRAIRPPANTVTLVASLTILFGFVCGYGAYWYGASITGPFIFGDECEYLLYGHDLFAGADLSKHTQYGILYPIFVAIFFHFGDVTSVYGELRAFNILVFISSVVPAFLFARALFPYKPVYWFLFSAFVVTTSFGAYVDVIWAEPLYFALFQYLILSLFLFYQRPRLVTGCIAGVLLGLLFNAKPGAGIIVQLAAFISLIALWGTETKRPARSTLLGPMLAMVVASGVLTVPCIVRNLSLGVGVIGYQGVTQDLKTLIAEVGGFEVATKTFLRSFYQLSYLFVATWGLLGVLVVVPFWRWKACPATLRGLTVFLVTSVIGLIALA